MLACCFNVKLAIFSYIKTRPSFCLRMICYNSKVTVPNPNIMHFYLSHRLYYTSLPHPLFISLPTGYIIRPYLIHYLFLSPQLILYIPTSSTIYFSAHSLYYTSLPNALYISLCHFTSVEPVNATLSTSGCSAMAAPAVGPYPGTIFNTPGGKPACKNHNHVIKYFIYK